MLNSIFELKRHVTPVDLCLNMNSFLWSVNILLLVFVPRALCDTKIWQPTTDISNPENWENKHDAVEDCSGLVFAETNTATVFVDSLRVKMLVLPRFGKIEFQDNNSFIELDENNSGSFNCVELKPLNRKDWGDFKYWKSRENWDNPAVPHYQRLPCLSDDVVFPHAFNSSIFYDQYLTFRGKSITFGTTFYDKYEVEDFLAYTTTRDVIYYPRSSLLDDPTVEYAAPNRPACQVARSKNIIKCKDPVIPHAFCREFKICGGYILLDGGSLNRIRQKLEKQSYASSTYAGRISIDKEEKVQIVFTEKDFTGISVDEIQDFYELLLADKLFSSQNCKLVMSGPYYEEGMLLKSTFLTVFGTLFAVVIVFGILFYMYGPKGEISLISLRNRLSTSRPLSTFLFAKYDNLEDQARIFEGQSMAGSVLSLDRSNDRSKYINSESPSTSSASLDTVVAKEDVGPKQRVSTNGKEFSEIELSDRKEPSVEILDEDLLLKDL